MKGRLPLESQLVLKKTKLAILATGALSFIGILVETAMNVTFPTLTRTLNVSLNTVQWVTTGYLLLVTLVMGTTAYLLKHFDARRLFRIAAILCVLGTLLCALADNFPILLIGRLAQAVATGLATPLMFHLIFSLIPVKKLGVYTGIASMITSFAPALGPTYGGLLNHYLSWRMIFWFVLPVILVITLLGDRTIRLKSDRSSAKFDFLGMSELSLFFISLIWAFNEGGGHGFLSRNFWGTLLIVCIAFALFVRHIKSGGRQLLDFTILKSPLVSWRAVNFFTLQFINIGISFVIPIFAQETLHYNSMMAGLILLPGSLLGAIVSPLAGRIYDRYGALTPLLISNFSMLIGSFLFFWLTNRSTLLMITLVYLFLRFGFNFGFGNTMSDSSKFVPASKKTDLNSLFNMLQQYAGSLGTSVLSAVISAGELSRSGQQVSAAVANGSHFDYLLLTILALVGLLSTLLVSRLNHSRHGMNLAKDKPF